MPLFLFGRNVDGSNAIVDDLNPLLPVPIDLFCLKNNDSLHKFPDDFCIKRLDVRVLTHKVQKPVGIKCSLFRTVNVFLKLRCSAFELLLFRFVGGRHLLEPLIADFAFDIIFVNFLNQHIQLCNSGICRFKLSSRFSQLLIQRFF